MEQKKMEKVTQAFWISAFHQQKRPMRLQWVKVKGVPFEVPGFEGIDLFLHRPLSGKMAAIEQKTFNWQVSDGLTGQTVGFEHKTQKAAIADILTRLKRLGSVEEYAKMVASVIKNMQNYRGFDMTSPRYGGSEDDQIGKKVG